MAAVAKISPYRKRDEGVALFIDWENLKISLQTVLQAEPDVHALLRVIDNYGQRGVSRAYADWQNYEHLHDDQTRLLMKSVETVQILGRNPDTHNPIKNSADVALAVEATRTCYRYPDLTTFVLVTGDGDLVHLVNELKRNRNKVIVVGVEGTISRLLRETVDQVIYYERDIEPHLSKPNHQSNVVDVDTVLEGIKKTLRDNRRALKLSDIGRIMGSKGISLRSSNYGLSELSDILVKRGEIESFEQNGVPYLRLSRSGSSNGRNRNARSSSRHESSRYESSRHESSRYESSNRSQPRQDKSKDSSLSKETAATALVASPPNSWQALSPEAQQHFLSAIYGLEQRSPFVTFNYLVEHLHQNTPDYKRDTLEAMTNALIDENILSKQRQGSGREARTVLQLNAEHDAVDKAALQAWLEAAAQAEQVEKAASDVKASAKATEEASSKVSSEAAQEHEQEAAVTGQAEQVAQSKSESDEQDGSASNDVARDDSSANELLDKEAEVAREEEAAQIQASSHHSVHFAAPVADSDIILSSELPTDAEEMWAFLQQAQAEKWVLEVVPQLNDADELVVPLQGLTATLPAGQLEMTRVDDASRYANKPIDVHVLTLERDDDAKEDATVVLSRRGVLARRMVKKEERLSRELYVGRDVTCRVIALNDYAAFVDLGGERGFIHASEISEPAPSRPDEVLTVGDVVVARVTLLDWARERVQLSIKQAQSFHLASTKHTTEDIAIELDSADVASSAQAENRVQQGSDAVQAHYVAKPDDSLTLHADISEDNASMEALMADLDADVATFIPVAPDEDVKDSAHDDEPAYRDEGSAGQADSKRETEVRETKVRETEVRETEAKKVKAKEAELKNVDAAASSSPSHVSEEGSARAETDTQRNRRPLRWTEVKEHYPEGSRITGKVNNVVDFGAFLTLEDKHSALLHKSELQKLEQWREGSLPKDVVSVGDNVDVLVKRHDNKRKHLILELADSVAADSIAADSYTLADETVNATDAIAPVLEQTASLEAKATHIEVSAAAQVDDAVTDVVSEKVAEASSSAPSRVARGMKIRSDLLAKPVKEAPKNLAGDLLFFDDDAQKEQRRPQHLSQAMSKEGISQADKPAMAQGIAQDFLIPSEDAAKDDAPVPQDREDAPVQNEAVQPEEKVQSLAGSLIAREDTSQGEEAKPEPTSDIESAAPQVEPTSKAEEKADEPARDYEAENELEHQHAIIQHATDVISHQQATYIPLTQLYHQLEQEGIELNPATFKNALVRAHQGRKLRIVRHPENRTLYAGLGVHTSDEISEILL